MLLKVWDVTTLSRLGYWLAGAWFLVLVVPFLVVGWTLASFYPPEVPFYTGEVSVWWDKMVSGMPPKLFTVWCYQWIGTAAWRYLCGVGCVVLCVVNLGHSLREVEAGGQKCG